MGLDYSFVVVTSTRRVDGLLEAVSRHVETDDAARLRAALPWSPAIDRVSSSRGGAPARDRRGIAKLPKMSTEVGLDLCLTFRFPTDDQLAQFKWRSHRLRPQDPPTVSIGCLWCGLLAGEERAVLRATAATSEMSQVLGRSANARALWRGIGADSGASAVFWDFEDPERWQLLVPDDKEVPKPGEDQYLLADGVHLDVDSYFGAALAEAGVTDVESEYPAV